MVKRGLAAVVAVLTVTGLGCGGPDFTTGGSYRGGWDSGFGSSYGSYGAYGGSSGSFGAPRSNRLVGRRELAGAYPMKEITFELGNVQGNPFDYQENDVLVAITKPDQTTIRVPAFFDGNNTWKVRYTPDSTGRHTVNQVTLNGRSVQPAKLEPREFTVSGSPSSGFIRRDPRHRDRFIFDNGSIYYPLGMNVAWDDVVTIISKLGSSGGNWARVWMCHWGGTNLDWVMSKKLPEGQLDLEVARKWDQIIQAAEKAGVYLQVVLQHHGQYSTRVNPNWSENPWNKANGGFLTTPGEFFVHPKALSLTQAKYRYILARWGYSPHVMAWELFNEVEWTDSAASKRYNEVVGWHERMARFLRQHDPYDHLVTTSSSLEIPNLYRSMDYLQPHAYPADPLAVIGRFDNEKLDRPVFFGEIGPDGLRDDGTFLHRALWASVASRMSGAAQYWAWDQVDKNNWYPRIQAVATFVRQSSLATYNNLRTVTPAIKTNERAPLTLRPGGGWSQAKRTEVTVPAGASSVSLADIPSFLQGNAHRSMFPALTLKTVFVEDGSVTVHVSRVARAGGAVRIQVDGQQAAFREFAGGSADRNTSEEVSANVKAGSHTITIDNPGADWVVVNRIDLSPYSPALGSVGKANDSFGMLWLFNRLASSVSGQVRVPGLKAGDYDVVWYDTSTGQAGSRSKVTVTGKDDLILNTPAIATDIAVTFVRSSTSSSQGHARQPARTSRR